MTDTSRPGRIFNITAVSNPRIKSIRGLSQKKFRDQTNTFFVEGEKLARDAFENGWKIEALIYSEQAKVDRSLEEFAAKVRVSGGDILEVNEKVLTSISRKDNPQTVIAVVKQKWANPPNGKLEPETVWIGLDRVRDPGNLGTIIRTADSSGADGIILIGETTDPFSLEATRASMGSIFNVPILKMTEADFINWKDQWLGKIVGTHLKGAVDFRSIDYASESIFLLMGNEQQGMPESLANVCDELALIPMHGAADSLNLAIATGVMLFHMGKRLPEIS